MDDDIPEIDLNIENPYALDIIDLRGTDPALFRTIMISARARHRASIIIDTDGYVIKNRLGYQGEVDPDKVIENYIKWREENPHG